MHLILDTSAILSGRMNNLPSGFDYVLITSAVIDEIGKGAPARILENLFSIGLRIMDPDDLEKAREMAAETGDIHGLSDTDLTIIALAVQLKDVAVMTDDFRIQNVLKKNGIHFIPSGEIGERSISSIWKWSRRCTGCGRYHDDADLKDCPVCGSPLKTKRIKSN
ncbi:MAG: NOB1 family endonuclease [Thermoplasmatota archaeon]